jgi:hypothetical protein
MKFFVSTAVISDFLNLPAACKIQISDLDSILHPLFEGWSCSLLSRAARAACLVDSAYISLQAFFLSSVLKVSAFPSAVWFWMALKSSNSAVFSYQKNLIN